MDQQILALIAFVLFMLASRAFLRHVSTRSKWVAADERGMPQALQGQEMAYAEQTFRSIRRGLVARIDRAYRTNGALVLVELKTRKQDAIYMSDVIELSVQRVVVQEQTDEPVDPDAWVIIENAVTGQRKAKKVRLLSINEVMAMREKYLRVKAGQIRRPEAARSHRMCETCGHHTRCHATFGDRAFGKRPPGDSKQP